MVRWFAEWVDGWWYNESVIELQGELVEETETLEVHCDPLKVQRDR